MTPRSRLRLHVPALLAAVVLAGCGPEFDPPSEINSLRVLAVQKDRPYAAPGDTVSFKMLWSDGSEEAGPQRPIEIGWLGGCVNPLGDLYQGCFEPGRIQPDPMTGEPPIGMGDEFSVTLPNDIISSRPPPPDPLQPPYGLSYVFFAACAGNLSLTVPLGCTDSNGNNLGSDDFVAGYTAIYSYEDFGNRNPIVRGLTIDGKLLADGCVDPASAAAAASDDVGALLGRAAASAGTGGAGDVPVVCDSAASSTPPEPPDCTQPNSPCVPVLSPNGVTTTSLDVRPEVYRSSVEEDAISKEAYGADYEEQMWINYYSTDGALRSDVRLLNDATTGLNDEFHTEISMPFASGPLTLWAVVHDNRGGVAWARGTIWVE